MSIIKCYFFGSFTSSFINDDKNSNKSNDKIPQLSLKVFVGPNGKWLLDLSFFVMAFHNDRQTLNNYIEPCYLVFVGTVLYCLHSTDSGMKQ